MNFDKIVRMHLKEAFLETLCVTRINDHEHRLVTRQKYAGTNTETGMINATFVGWCYTNAPVPVTVRGTLERNDITYKIERVEHLKEITNDKMSVAIHVSYKHPNYKAITRWKLFKARVKSLFSKRDNTPTLRG